MWWQRDVRQRTHHMTGQHPYDTQGLAAYALCSDPRPATKRNEKTTLLKMAVGALH